MVRRCISFYFSSLQIFWVCTLCLPLLRRSFLGAHPIPHHTTRLWQNRFLQGNVPLLPLYHQPEKKTTDISHHLISSADKRGLKSNQLFLVINPEWDNSIKAKETNQRWAEWGQLSTCETCFFSFFYLNDHKFGHGEYIYLSRKSQTWRD